MELIKNNLRIFVELHIDHLSQFYLYFKISKIHKNSFTLIFSSSNKHKEKYDVIWSRVTYHDIGVHNDCTQRGSTRHKKTCSDYLVIFKSVISSVNTNKKPVNAVIILIHVVFCE